MIDTSIALPLAIVVMMVVVAYVAWTLGHRTGAAEAQAILYRGLYDRCHPPRPSSSSSSSSSKLAPPMAMRVAPATKREEEET